MSSATTISNTLSVFSASCVPAAAACDTPILSVSGVEANRLDWSAGDAVVPLEVGTAPAGDAVVPLEVGTAAESEVEAVVPL